MPEEELVEIMSKFQRENSASTSRSCKRRHHTNARLLQARRGALRGPAPRNAVEPCPGPPCRRGSAPQHAAGPCSGREPKPFTETPAASCFAASPSSCPGTHFGGPGRVGARVALLKEATLHGQSPQSNPKAHHRTCHTALVIVVVCAVLLLFCCVVVLLCDKSLIPPIIRRARLQGPSPPSSGKYVKFVQK